MVLCVLIVDRGTAKCFHNFCFLCFDQVLDIVGAKPGGSEPLNRNIVGGQDLLSSWVREDAVGVSRQSSNMYLLWMFLCAIGEETNKPIFQ